MNQEYKIVVAEAPDVLECKVNSLVEIGFIPVGGLNVKGCKLMQVMTLNIYPEINVHAPVQNNY